MWIYFYVSGPKVRDVARQISQEEPTERTRKRKTGVTPKVSGTAKVGKLFSFLGAEAEGSAEVGVEYSLEVEEKYRIPDEAVVDRVCEHFAEESHYIRLHNKSAASILSLLGPSQLVRFSGRFMPIVQAESLTDCFSILDAAKAISWRGTAGDVGIDFDTSMQFVSSPSMVRTCLRTGQSIVLEGFGLVIRTDLDAREVSLTPILFGAEFGK